MFYCIGVVNFEELPYNQKVTWWNKNMSDAFVLPIDVVDAPMTLLSNHTLWALKQLVKKQKLLRRNIISIDH